MSTTTKTVEFDAAYDSGQPCTVAEQIAHAVCIFQRLATGHTPRAVSVVLSTDTLVVTLHEALTPAERAVFQSENGAARVREFHQHLFANSSRSLRQEIQFITGLHVRDATAEVEPKTGAIMHAFTTGDMVQVVLLKPNMPATT